MRMQSDLKDLTDRRANIEAGGADGAKQKLKQADKMTARERIAILFDEGSFVEVGAFVKPRSTDYNMIEVKAPADGVVTGYGTVNGHLVYVYSQDVTVLGGSLGEMHAKKIVNAYDLAMKVGAPIVGLLDSTGMRLQEATDALDGYGQIFVKQSLASGVIPQITAILGTCGGSAAMLPSLSDFVIMTKENTKLYLNSANTLEDIKNASSTVGDSDFHMVNAGIVDVVCENDKEAIEAIQKMIELMPANNMDGVHIEASSDDFNRLIPEFNYDMVGGLDGVAVVETIMDEGTAYELKEAYGADVTTMIGKLGGMTVGMIANNSLKLDGRLSMDGCKKIADFVKKMDAFHVPVVTLVDVAGYTATLSEEMAGQAKAVASMITNYTEATVPKVTLITGRAIGSAYLAMNSKHIGADYVYAWPCAEVGIMDGEMAVKIMYADEIEASQEANRLIREKAKEYNEQQSSIYTAAARGYVDDIIEPAATRKRLIAVLDMLFTKYMMTPDRKHRSV